MDRSPLPAAPLRHGDLVRVTFDPPHREKGYAPIAEAVGTILRVAGLTYLQATSHRRAWSMPLIVDLDAPGRQIERIATAQALKAGRAAEARGAIVFRAAGATARAIERQLDDLAERIVSAEAAAKTGRAAELRLQLADIADHVVLARRKRTYILQRARLGADFHPWTTPDPRIFRIETVRPLPADFEPERASRRDRARRLEEAIGVFGEAERETRTLASAFRAAGHHVRRPHPNAQELLVRIAMGPSMRADIRLAPSANGPWAATAAAPQNKRQARAAARLRREGHVERAARLLARVLPR